MPSSRQARMTRTAISPRLAIRIFWSTGPYPGAVSASAATPSSGSGWPEPFAVTWVEETGSTNADLVAAARAGASAGTVLVADHQTAGRGRLDRTWQAPPGASLLLSVLFRVDLPVADAHLLTTAVGVSAVDACQELTEVQARLKWPNDIVVDAGSSTVRKLGGIL